MIEIDVSIFSHVGRFSLSICMLHLTSTPACVWREVYYRQNWCRMHIGVCFNTTMLLWIITCYAYSIFECIHRISYKYVLLKNITDVILSTIHTWVSLWIIHACAQIIRKYTHQYDMNHVQHCRYDSRHYHITLFLCGCNICPHNRSNVDKLCSFPRRSSDDSKSTLVG